MTYETKAGMPDELDQIQDSIEEQLDAGATDAAISELSGLRAPDQADVIADLEDNHAKVVLGELSEAEIASIVEHLDVEDAADTLGLIAIDTMARVLDQAPPDVAADVLRAVDWEIARGILSRMEDHSRISQLLLYPDDDAGGLMTPEVIAFNQNISSSHAMQILRESDLPRENFRQLFAVDRQGRLVGRLNMADLVFASPRSTIRTIMDTDLISVETGTDQEECARLMSRYELRSLPVVDADGVLAGAVAIEDIIQVAEDEATEDMLKMVGAAGDERLTGPIRTSVRNRFPWLLVNLVTVLFAGLLVSLFDGTIESLAIIAAFIPVVSGQAGIAGTQTVTLLVRSLTTGDIDTHDSPSIIIREGVLAIVQGIAIAGLLGGVVWAWQSDLILGLIVAGSLLGNLVLAAIAGVLIPVGLRTLNMDPATSSAVIVTTLTDSFGILIYLSLATIFLSQIT